MPPGRLTVLLACAACGAAICFNRVSVISNAGYGPSLENARHIIGVLGGVIGGLAVGGAIIGLHALVVKLLERCKAGL